MTDGDPGSRDGGGARDPNIYEPDYEELREHEGFRARRTRIGRRAGARDLGVSVWEVQPGQAAYPYHFHLREEEVVIVLEGEASLRTPDGWRVLARGSLVRFAPDESGAHQIVNRGAEPLRMIAISTSGQPDVFVYPDSRKVGVSQRRPDGGGVRGYYWMDATVDYYEGEAPPTD